MIEVDKKVLIGHKNILDYLEAAHAANQLAHAYLLLGPKGVGKMTLLENFLPQLIATKTLSHPDIRLLEPENNTISIDAVRQLRQWLHESPLVSKAKAAVINDAHRMNTEAQNALLKILEEPAANTYLFLLAPSRKLLLPTIVSRSVAIKFNPVPRQELLQHGLQGDAHGRPGLLIEPCEQESARLFLKKLAAVQSKSERMQLWMQEGPAREETRVWLEQSIPVLRSLIINPVAGVKRFAVAQAIRNTQNTLSGPSGQNWQLVAEAMILAI